jgi:hypothetical protein
MGNHVVASSFSNPLGNDCPSGCRAAPSTAPGRRMARVGVADELDRLERFAGEVIPRLTA